MIQEMMTMTRMKTIYRKNKDMIENENKVNKNYQQQKEKYDENEAMKSTLNDKLFEQFKIIKFN